jgi:hypothetical protein
VLNLIVKEALRFFVGILRLLDWHPGRDCRESASRTGKWLANVLQRAADPGLKPGFLWGYRSGA